MLVRLSDPDFDGDEEEDDPTFAGKTSVVKKYINDLRFAIL